MLAYERAHGRCESCGIPTGRIALVGRRWRVVGAHIHHVLPISRGGRHELTNLSVRCASCHHAEHPGNQELGSR